MTKTIVMCAVLAVFALSAPAMAAIVPGGGEIGFDYGNTQLDSNTGLDSASSLAVRGGYFVNQMFQLEGQFASTSDNQDVSGINVDAKMKLYMVNGVFNFDTGKDLTPYVLVGVGMINSTFEVPGITFDDSGVAYQVGAGSRFYFGKAKRTAFRVDLSMINENTFDESSTHTNVSGGFTWNLGSGH